MRKIGIRHTQAAADGAGKYERGKLVVAFSERDGVTVGVFDITLKKV